jgi:hypothetical protein
MNILNKKTLTIKDIGCTLFGIKEEVHFKTGFQMWQETVQLFEDVIKEKYPNDETIIQEFRNIVEK